jgi:type I restriction enzyme, R subunit
MAGISGGLSEDDWETLVVEVLGEIGWRPVLGSEIAPGRGERPSGDELAIPPRLLDALRKLNPEVPGQYLQQALTDILAPRSQDAITENHRLHDYLVNGYRGITYYDAEGAEQNPTIRLIGTDPDANDWLVARQVTVIQGEHHRRFDVVLYCNGMPVAVIELKRAGSPRADVASAHAQLGTYLDELPMAFRFALCVVASDGITAKYGTPFTPLHHFSPWNLDDDGAPATPGRAPGDDTDDEADGRTDLDTLLWGVFNTDRFLQLLRSYTAFDEGAEGLAKRIAKPHQYFAVTKAVASTITAARSNGKAGVVWHTQGSGKSMEMELYVAELARRPELHNPTVIVITDRKELDGQLFESFKRSLLLPTEPLRVTTRAQLRHELGERNTGGIYFTTLQKFSRNKDERDAGADHPLLCDRRNVVVVVDEAHRSHYDDLDGYAKFLKDALPHATLIAFTGTPISFEDRNTRKVFGDYIDVYDLTRAVQDGATVPVYFEPRLIRVTLADGVTEAQLDAAADEMTAGLDDVERDRIEKGVAVVNAVYGAPERLATLAEDLVQHWENRRGQMEQYIAAPGKALVVTGTRQIAADLYDAVIALRPDWHSPDINQGRIKVVYSGTPADRHPIAQHVRRDSQNTTIKTRLKDVDDELEIVIVKDMMLTGYDSPPLHTLYLDRPLKGALLMQTLARVNRTFRSKPDGLLVAYAPLAENLQRALAEYTPTDQENKPIGRDISEAVELAEQLVTALRGLLAGHDWRSRLRGGPRDWIAAATGAVNYLRDPATPGNQPTDGGQTLGARYRALSNQLARAWAVSSGSTNLTDLAEEVKFYNEVRVWMAKFDAQDRQSRGEPVPEDIGRLLGQLIADSTGSGEIVDIYAAAGIPTPSLTDLGPDFTRAAQQASNPHLAIEALRALLTEEAERATGLNVIRQRAFSERITELMRKYTNAQLTSAEVIAELVSLAREVVAEADRGARFSPPLGPYELAFYDAVAQNGSAVQIQGEGMMADIARELVVVMRRDVRTDWLVRDDVRAKLRSSIKRLLVKHGYPPDKQPAAVKLVIEQMETMAPRFAADQEP